MSANEEHRGNFPPGGATIRYTDGWQLRADLICEWKRAFVTEAVQCSNGPTDGPKAEIINAVFALFGNHPQVDSIALVRAGGPPIFLTHENGRWFDVYGREIEVS
jgi:hypothetical protein